MSLKYLDEQIEAVRVRATAGQVGAQRERREIEQNPNLSAEGKKLEIAEVNDYLKSSMAALRAEEGKLADDKRAELERTVLGTVDTDPSSVISYRDAQDRAEKITDSAEAERLMSRALSSGDKTLAIAIAHTALEKRYSTAYKLFAASNPAIAEAARRPGVVRRMAHAFGVHATTSTCTQRGTPS